MKSLLIIATAVVAILTASAPAHAIITGNGKQLNGKEINGTPLNLRALSIGVSSLNLTFEGVTLPDGSKTSQ